MIPIGLNLTSIGVSSAWWLESAWQAEAAGFSAAWCWDHFVSQGRNKASPVLECWTTLAAAAAVTRRVRLGSLVTNVLNRHPAVLARMLATVAEQSGGRVELGIGAGGNRAELEMYGIAFPSPTERLARLEETIAVLRRLWSGGPVNYEGRYFRLRDAWAHPVPSPPPRIIVGASGPAGVRLAARVADGWTADAPVYQRLLPLFLDELAAAGRARAQVTCLVALDVSRDEPVAGQPLVAHMADVLSSWQERGADELVVNWVRPADLPLLLAAAEKAGLAD